MPSVDGSDTTVHSPAPLGNMQSQHDGMPLPSGGEPADAALRRVPASVDAIRDANVRAFHLQDQLEAVQRLAGERTDRARQLQARLDLIERVVAETESRCVELEARLRAANRELAATSALVSGAQAVRADVSRSVGEALAVLGAPDATDAADDGELTARVARLVARAREVAAQQRRILSSRSWRITRPLRVIARLLRRVASHGARPETAVDAAVASTASVGASESRVPATEMTHASDAAAPLDASTAPTGVDGDPPVASDKDARANAASVAPDVTGLVFPTPESPRASILIAAYGRADLVVECLRSIRKHAPEASYEVIVVEDASGDPGMDALAAVPGLVFLRNAGNLGYLRSCNHAATHARGEFLFLLNSDTQVTAGWLDASLALFDRFPDCGLVGSKLVFPDGRLQEAGGIVWDDASAWNYGRDGDAEAAEFNYVREVDYCSAAAVLLRTRDFLADGGYDERYAPAYYEDTDLAFRLRDRGLKTYYCPRSTVVHAEGGTHGTDPEAGVKAAQGRNREIFRERWSHVLAARHYPNGEHVLRAREHARHKRYVLLVDHTLPQPERDAGSRAILQTAQQLAAMGLCVKFWPDDRRYDVRFGRALEDAGVEILAGGRWAITFEAFAREYGHDFAFAILSRPNFAGPYIAPLRAHGAARILLYGHDLHFRRMQAQAALTGDESDRLAAQDMFRLESSIWAAVDGAIYPSIEEADIVAQHAGPEKAFAVPLYFFPEGGFARYRSHDEPRLLFVACFGHPPNEDAAEWLVREILPQVSRNLPGAVLELVGSMPTERVLALAGPRVRIYPDVSAAELEAHYAAASVVIAPMRFGGGVKLKVVEAMARGVPVVTTPVGVQGLPELDGGVRVAADAAGLAAAVVALATQPDEAGAAVALSQDYLRRHYSSAVMRAALWRALVGHGAATARRPA